MHLTLLKLRCQQGFTTITLMGVLAVGGLLLAAGFAAVDPDISLSREDQDYKQSYGAAESGLQWYLNSLGTDNNYYTLCTTDLPAPGPGETAPVNQKWNSSGTDPRVWRNLPGESARYTVELLPAPGFTQCVPGNQYSMIDPNGNMRLRVTGRSRGETRSVLATLRRRNFIDFVYFTDYETLDPAAYSNPVTAEANCARYRAGRVGRGCTEIRFTDTDDQLGPVHTNDNFLICGTPQFGRTKRDRVEASNGPSPWDASCASTPDVRGTLEHPAAALGMPPSNREISNIALPAYKFRGKTIIDLQGSNMLVTNRTMFPDGLAHSMPLPGNGVIWAEATTGTCTSTYDTSQDYSDPRLPCGDVWVKGNYARDLTIAADGDIVINGNLERSSGGDGLLLGLIANNFVRVYHPTYTDDNCSTNDAGLDRRPEDPGRDPRTEALVHRGQLELRAAARGAARGRSHRAEVPWTGRYRQRPVDRHGLPQGLRLQRPSALPRAAVLHGPGPGLLARRAPERAGRRLPAEEARQLRAQAAPGRWWWRCGRGPRGCGPRRVGSPGCTRPSSGAPSRGSRCRAACSVGVASCASAARSSLNASSARSSRGTVGEISLRRSHTGECASSSISSSA